MPISNACSYFFRRVRVSKICLRDFVLSMCRGLQGSNRADSYEIWRAIQCQYSPSFSKTNIFYLEWVLIRQKIWAFLSTVSWRCKFRIWEGGKSNITNTKWKEIYWLRAEVLVREIFLLEVPRSLWMTATIRPLPPHRGPKPDQKMKFCWSSCLSWRTCSTFSLIFDLSDLFLFVGGRSDEGMIGELYNHFEHHILSGCHGDSYLRGFVWECIYVFIYDDTVLF